MLKGKNKKLKLKEKESEDTNQASEPDSGMANILELSDWEFKITMINILRTLMEKWIALKTMGTEMNI